MLTTFSDSTVRGNPEPDSGPTRSKLVRVLLRVAARANAGLCERPAASRPGVLSLRRRSSWSYASEMSNVPRTRE